MSLPSQLGAAGALARFWLRSYAADYIALGIIAAGWLLVSFPLFALMYYYLSLIGANRTRANGLDSTSYAPFSSHVLLRRYDPTVSICRG
jgi:hypothetical protein